MKADRKSIPVINPADEEVIGEIPRGNADDADRAVLAAREAFLKWRWVSGIEKAIKPYWYPYSKYNGQSP